MDHDALNKAYDDEVSRLFRELCHNWGAKEALEEFMKGMTKADTAYDAVNKFWREQTAGMVRYMIADPPAKVG